MKFRGFTRRLWATGRMIIWIALFVSSLAVVSSTSQASGTHDKGKKLGYVGIQILRLKRPDSDCFKKAVERWW